MDEEQLHDEPLWSGAWEEMTVPVPLIFSNAGATAEAI